METIDAARIAAKCMDDKKAEDIVVLDIRDLTAMADYFVICSVNSAPQMRAVYEEIDEKMSEKGLEPNGREGFDGAYWILMDYGDVIIHIFNKESREFYSIENLWADAQRMSFDELLKQGEQQ